LQSYEESYLLHLVEEVEAEEQALMLLEQVRNLCDRHAPILTLFFIGIASVGFVG